MYNYSGPTSLGIEERWERVLAYAFWWVGALVLLLVEQKNENVRRHAKQSLLIFGALSVMLWLTGLVAAGFGLIPLIGWFFTIGLGLVHGLLWIIAITLWIVLMVLAYSSARTLIVGPRQDRMM